ncbi:Non-specific lipid-transfer protein [Papilio xuthus]|uniref:Sterol carrier protein 2 n=1 Tax=Papilio xuthus TaxID=66420 RepID=A0A194Q2K5_PAPXU|nr:Non-specific lipid-transfer protein [Papilio xuthus]
MGRKVYVVGVGMTKFVKPSSGNDYPEMGKEAVQAALADARIPYEVVQQAVCGYVFGDSTCGQRVLYQVGMTGIPIYNVNNNCSTGSNALFIAKQFIEGGVADVVLAVGFEKMAPGALGGSGFTDRTNPLDRHTLKMADMVELAAAPMTAQYFGNAAMEHMKKYGTTEVHLAKIAAKNHRHGAKNPRAQNGREYTVEEVLKSRKIYGPLTKLECCPTSDGAGAAVLMSEEAVIKYGLQKKAVEIIGMEMATDTAAVFKENSLMKVAGYDMTAFAAKRLYEKTGISPKQIDVVELHDCFAANEMITYEGLQLCGEGEAGKFIDSGDNTYGGRVVVNPSGGLIAKGHPLGATGLAQCAELVWQLRGEAEDRQVPRARIALQHNLGLGGAVVIAMYRKGFENAGPNPVAAITDNPDGFKVAKYMKVLEEAMQTDEENLIEKVRGIYGFKVRNGPSGAEGYWVVNAKDGKGKITYNGKEKPDVTFTISDDDVVELISGKLNPQKAFFQGKIKIQGNMGLAMKLTDLQRSAASRIETIRSKL